MLDFTVPNSPGWGERVLAEGGSEEDHIGAISPRMLAAIEELREAEQGDEDIDCSDIPATTGEDWVGAVRGKFYRPTEKR